MKNNKKIVIFVGVLVLMILSLLIILSISNRNRQTSWKDETSQEEIFLSKNATLKIRSKNSDVKIYYWHHNTAKVLINDEKRELYSIQKDQNNLEIIQERDESCIGFCFGEDDIIVYLPQNFEGAIDVEGISSDIELTNFEKAKAEVTTRSGDIEVGNINQLTASSTSGDITVERANNLSLTSTSGDIEVTSVKTVKASTTSGEIEFDEVKSDLEIRSTSGDITIESLFLEKNSSIQTVSGEVYLKRSNPMMITTKSTSGNVRIPNDNTGNYHLNIETISGDIRVK